MLSRKWIEGGLMSRRQRDQLEVYCSCQRVVPWIRVIVMEVVGVQR